MEKTNAIKDLLKKNRFDPYVLWVLIKGNGSDMEMGSYQITEGEETGEILVSVTLEDIDAISKLLKANGFSDVKVQPIERTKGMTDTTVKITLVGGMDALTDATRSSHTRG